MRVPTVAVLCSAQLAAAVATTMKVCTYDNCLQAVIASAFTTRNSTADCSSYFATTVTPATVTITPATVAVTPDAVSVTATVTPAVTTVSLSKREDAAVIPRAPTTEYIRPALEKRPVTVVSTSIPAYASACSGAVHYSSACSCAGVTGTTVTVAAPSVTAATRYTTLAPVTTPVATVVGPPASTLTQCSSPQPTFYIQAIFPGQPGNQIFGQISTPNQGYSFVDFTALNQAEASLFTLNAAGNLLQGRFVAFIDGSIFVQPLFFKSANSFSTSNIGKAVCSIDGAGSLTCNADAQTILQLCTQELYIGGYTRSDCVTPTFKTIPACTPPPAN